MKFYKNTQLGRSILSKCGVDKQMFLSDVYKKRTQAKKHQLDAPQFGRSMVEMLGVLAIIGVLSVGGIAGYSKAMLKYKINNTLDTLSQVVARIIELRTSNSLAGSFNTNNTDVNNLGIECDLFKYDNSNQHCLIPFGAYEFSILNSMGDFYINLDGGNDSAAFCTEFFTSEIYKTLPEDWWSNDNAHIMIHSSGNVEYIYANANNESMMNRGAKTELNAADIADACAPCKESMCQINWYMWYVE